MKIMTTTSRVGVLLDRPPRYSPRIVLVSHVNSRKANLFSSDSKSLTILSPGIDLISNLPPLSFWVKTKQ